MWDSNWKIEKLKNSNSPKVIVNWLIKPSTMQRKTFTIFIIFPHVFLLFTGIFLLFSSKNLHSNFTFDTSKPTATHFLLRLLSLDRNWNFFETVSLFFTQTLHRGGATTFCGHGRLSHTQIFEFSTPRQESTNQQALGTEIFPHLYALSGRISLTSEKPDQFSLSIIFGKLQKKIFSHSEDTKKFTDCAAHSTNNLAPLRTSCVLCLQSTERN